MNARSLRAIAFAGLCAVAPLSAHAAEYHVVYDATVTDGSDDDNIFGLAGQNLVGMLLHADVTYSTSVPGTRTTTATSDEVFGGLNFGTGAVISSVVFTLGSQSFSFSPSYYGDVYTTLDFMDAYGYDLLGNSFQTYILPDNPAPVNLEIPFSSTGIGDKGGRLSQYSFFSNGGGDLIDFDAFNVTVSAVPEPATWALMVAGFGLIGGTLRRRQRVIAKDGACSGSQGRQVAEA